MTNSSPPRAGIQPAPTPDICPSCGVAHGGLSVSIPVSRPTLTDKVPPAEWAERVWSNGEMCVIDDERFFLYGSVMLPITGHADEFAWGAWAEISEELFMWYQGIRGDEGRETNAPFAAVMATDIPFYPVTLGLPLMVRIEPLGLRPDFVLDAGPHPLVQDQAGGVSPERVESIKAWFASIKAG
ncbi:DUF2199 domain-containing protein [Acidovorax sp. A1169]|jgi:hypothetical protein|uniref:DUF2199 domain-containing protein n=1 Tax=Acidovorax sp. A1169 TaxID=3059524 RepID=UPI002737DBBE|nr:DUF2199 domain-containing protein [Acidovorax sp. A1169]MDP4074094.1 DUF2199 domain-containing protein [Acidovorax sp. A1169]